MPSIASNRSPWDWLGASGLWPALYTGGVGVAVAAGAGWSWPALVATVLGAQGVYLLDRVRLSDRLIDPADVESDPRRFACLTPIAGRWRMLAIGLLLVSTGMLWRVDPVSAVAPIGFAALGVVYAGAPGRSRGLRGVPGSKALLVGLGVTLYAEVAMVGREVLSAWMPLLVITLVVAADTALCDLEDAETDLRTGAGSLSRWLAPGWVIAVAALAQAIAAFVGWMSGLHAGVVIGLAAMALSTPIAARLQGLAGRLKDWVDVRGAVIAGAIVLALGMPHTLTQSDGTDAGEADLEMTPEGFEPSFPG